MKKPLSQLQFSKICGLSQPTIHRHIKTGLIPADCIVEEIKNGRTHKKILPDKALKALRRNTNIAMSRKNRQEPAKTVKNGSETIKSAGLQSLSMHDAQTYQARFKAAILKLEFEEKAKKLLPKEKVEADAFNFARDLRDSVLAIPDRIAAVVASENDPFKVREILNTELITALEKVASDGK